MATLDDLIITDPDEIAELVRDQKTFRDRLRMSKLASQSKPAKRMCDHCKDMFPVPTLTQFGLTSKGRMKWWCAGCYRRHANT